MSEPTSTERCDPKLQLIWQRVDARSAAYLDLELVCGYPVFRVPTITTPGDVFHDSNFHENNCFCSFLHYNKFCLFCSCSWYVKINIFYEVKHLMMKKPSLSVDVKKLAWLGSGRFSCFRSDISWLALLLYWNKFSKKISWLAGRHNTSLFCLNEVKIYPMWLSIVENLFNLSMYIPTPDLYYGVEMLNKYIFRKF
jgi:hypothetical protein